MAKTRFGQMVIGPPGSGKTTYVAAMAELLRSLGRNVAIINLDPANENMTYTADMDISDLVQVEEVMEQMKLGPNGGLMYAIQFARTNLDWVDSNLGKIDLRQPGGLSSLLGCWQICLGLSDLVDLDAANS